MPALALVDTRHEYQHVFDIYVPIGVGVFVLFAVLIVFFAIRGRFRPRQRAARLHENNPLEAGYAVLLACVAAFLLYITFSTEHKIDSVSLTEHPYVTIDVTASQWEWTFYYPSFHITHRSGFVGSQPLVVPTGEPVRFNVFSRDVIHSFWIPAVNFKRDAIPGAREVFVLDFPRQGRFVGHCAEFCGLRHAEMIFAVRAVSPTSFNAWGHSGGRVGP